MPRVRHFLRGLIREVNNNMSAILSALAIASLTAGFATLLWAVGRTDTFYADLWKALIFVGTFFLIVSLELLRREQGKRDKERDALLNELKGLRSDLRNSVMGGKAEQRESESESGKRD